MSDATYDVVIVGGGNKALFTAMYLTRYAGMKVAIFDARHELGGGLASHENTGPGFTSDPHASNFREWYFKPIYDDFPDFEAKGGRLLRYPVTLAIIRREDQACWTVYHEEEDPSGERTASEMARFSGQRDAETYLKLREVFRPGTAMEEAFLKAIFSPPPLPHEDDPFEKALKDYASRPDAVIDHRWLNLPPAQAALELWENKKIVIGSCMHLDAFEAPYDLGTSEMLLSDFMYMPRHYFSEGGTHNLVHACVRIYVESGGEYFTKTLVEKVLIENGKAVGIRLADGSEVRAKNFVVTGVNPSDLVFRLIGAENLSSKIVHKIESLHHSYAGVNWYTWAIHEQPAFKASAFNPDVQNAHWLVLGPGDYGEFLKQMHDRFRGVFPPLKGHLVVWGRPTIYDKTRAPEGKHLISTQFKIPAADALSKRGWMEFRRKHAEDVIEEMQVFTTGMSWDNVIGYDPITPYDNARTPGFSLAGGGGIERIHGQLGKHRPIAEFARHRTPIQNLYCTGSAFGNGRGGASSCEGYACYKAIAEDHDLPKPWVDKGRPY